MHDERYKETKGKPELSLVPTQIVRDIAYVRMYAVHTKYPEGGKENWRIPPGEVYLDAAYRHLLLEMEDPGGLDKESGLSHLSHLACDVAFLCQLAAEGKRKDDKDVDPAWKF